MNRTTDLRDLAGSYSPAQRRTVEVALALFAVHGVGGTSLQMIADALGVTKAAVYHQFRTKDGIVRAALEIQLAPFEELLEEAVGAGPEPGSRESLLTAVVALIVENRESFGVLQRDPVLFRSLGEYPPSLRMWNSMFGFLLGEDLDDRALVKASILSAAFGAASYPLVVEVDDETVREELLAVTTRLARGR